MIKTKLLPYQELAMQIPQITIEQVLFWTIFVIAARYKNRNK